MSLLRVLGEVFYEELDRKLKEVRRKTGLKQNAVGLAMRLIPAIVRKVREIVFARLMAGGRWLAAGGWRQAASSFIGGSICLDPAW
jgi:hypothetical protein